MPQANGGATPSGVSSPPPRIPKIAEQIAARLRRRIIRGELREGESLPTEPALLREFGVSRPTLREAFRVLESEMLIRIHRGAHGGARVQAPNGEVAARYTGHILQYRGVTMHDVFEARAIFEPRCVALLAQRRTDDDLKKLRDCLDRDERTSGTDTAAITAMHVEFHSLLIELAGNETLALLNEMLHQINDRVAAESVEFASEQHLDEAWVEGRGFHRRVIELIEAQEAAAAEALWEAHLKSASDFILASPRALTVLDLLDGG